MTAAAQVGQAPFQIIQGDALEILRTLPAESVHCCITSPPYWGLRDYKTGRWEGGSADCDHGVRRWEGLKQTQGAQSGHASSTDRLDRHVCKCGAIRIDQQIGLEDQRPAVEPTAQKYHRCPAPGCNLLVPNRLLACSPHWGALPVDVRRAILAAYRPGQTVATASEAWKQANRQAMAIWELGAKGARA